MGADPDRTRGVHLRKRIPFLFAALLFATLVVVAGVAAFSISDPEAPPQEQHLDTAISGRVGAAILAVSVSPTQPTAGGEVSAPAVDASTPAVMGTTSSSAASGADTNPPRLVVASPEDGATVTTNVIEFAGTSEPGAIVSSGPFSATTHENGDWTIKLVLTAGYNSTVFTALDPAGNATSVRAVVFYDPPDTPTTTNAPPTPTTTNPPATTTTTPPSGESCPVGADADAPGSCSPQWPATPAGKRDVEEWRPLVAEYWPAEHVDCVLGIIRRESLGNPQAHNLTSHTRGLMQHRPEYWNWRAVGAGFVDENGITAHPYNAEANIAAGAYLSSRHVSVGKPWWWAWKKRSGDEWVFPTSYGSCSGG